MLISCIALPLATPPPAPLAENSSQWESTTTKSNPVDFIRARRLTSLLSILPFLRCIYELGRTWAARRGILLRTALGDSWCHLFGTWSAAAPSGRPELAARWFAVLESKRGSERESFPWCHRNECNRYSSVGCCTKHYVLCTLHWADRVALHLPGLQLLLVILQPHTAHQCLRVLGAPSMSLQVCFSN